MYISKVIINNFRNIENASFDVDGTAIFIGENNSGKSNMLRAITLPLFSEDNTVSKSLSWEDINSVAKEKYYSFLYEHRQDFINGKISLEVFESVIPVVSVELHFSTTAKDMYYVKNISFEIDENGIQCGLLYKFSVEHKDKLFEVVKNILSDEFVEIAKVKRNLLPINLFSHSITVPQRNSKVSYDDLKRFRYTMLPAERDGFSYDGNKIGYKSLVKLLESRYSSEDILNIEKEYQTFFDAVKKIGDVESIFNWQDESKIINAKDFINSISILPNMPPLSSILNGVKLGYADEGLSMQGLGYRNLILLLVLLNSWEKCPADLVLNVLIMEEPEAHLCINNIRLMCSFINTLTKDNDQIQLIFASHSTEFINKHDLSKLIILDFGKAYALLTELNQEERDYLSKNPNTDIYKLFLSHRCVLVEGISEELFIKAYQCSKDALSDIDVLSFHKGYTKIIDIWLKTNSNSKKKLGVVRDFDNQSNAKLLHEKYNQYSSIRVATTSKRTLEPEIVYTGRNYEILKESYGNSFNWKELSKDELADAWEKEKASVMLTIAQDLSKGNLTGFTMPSHIQEIFDFMIGE